MMKEEREREGGRDHKHERVSVLKERGEEKRREEKRRDETSSEMWEKQTKRQHKASPSQEETRKERNKRGKPLLANWYWQWQWQGRVIAAA